MTDVYDDYEGSDVEAYEDALEELETERKEGKQDREEDESFRDSEEEVVDKIDQHSSQDDVCESGDRNDDVGAESSDKHVPLHEKLNEENTQNTEEEEEEEEIKDDKKSEFFVDEKALKELEANMTDEQKIDAKDQAQELKSQGNDEFKAGDYYKAMQTYTSALKQCPPCFVKERAIMYSNRAACRLKREQYSTCIEDCTVALELHPTYLKALLRRAESYEKNEQLEEALKDYEQVIQLDPQNGPARAACMRLPGEIHEKNEKLKAEMMDKLKDLGNMVLRPFGLSTNNFQLQQNPDTGSYSINFNQNPPN